jgi:hypothetical protein
MFRINNLDSYFKKRDMEHDKVTTFGDKTEPQLGGEDKLLDSLPLKRMKGPNKEFYSTSA